MDNIDKIMAEAEATGQAVIIDHSGARLITQEEAGALILSIIEG